MNDLHNNGLENKIDFQKLKEVDIIETSKYNSMIEDIFGNITNSPLVKKQLEYFAKFFRYVMLNSTILSINGNISPSEYDVTLINYDINNATNTYIDSIKKNRDVLEPFIEEFENISEYIEKFISQTK